MANMIPSNSLSPQSSKRRPLLEPQSERVHYADESTVFSATLNLFHGGLVAPAETTYDSIHQLLVAETLEERDELTKQWRDHKLQELNFIGVVGALLAGCLTSTGSWPAILDNGTEQPWPVRACWYCGIVFSLFSVLTAAQQSVRLHRLSAHKDSMMNIRHYMGSRVKNAMTGEVEIKPRRFQVYGWQASVMFLGLSVLSMLLGMVILIWASTQYGPSKRRGIDSWWDNAAKVSWIEGDHQSIC